MWMALLSLSACRPSLRGQGLVFPTAAVAWLWGPPWQTSASSRLCSDSHFPRFLISNLDLVLVQRALLGTICVLSRSYGNQCLRKGHPGPQSRMALRSFVTPESPILSCSSKASHCPRPHPASFLGACWVCVPSHGACKFLPVVFLVERSSKLSKRLLKGDNHANSPGIPSCHSHSISLRQWQWVLGEPLLTTSIDPQSPSAGERL